LTSEVAGGGVLEKKKEAVRCGAPLYLWTFYP